MSDLFKLLQPLQFLQSFLKRGARPDGRNFDQYREVLLICDCIHTANGSAMVKLGTSTVICGVKTSLVKPPSDLPDKGIVDISVKFSQTCATDLDNPDRVAISDYVRECLKKVFYHAEVLDLEKLCLIPRKQVWKLKLEIICLNLNGSIVDLSLLAAIGALHYCKLRKYNVDDDLALLTATEQYYPLMVNCLPMFVTFCVVDNYILVDPEMSEEELSDSLIRIAVNPDMPEDDRSESIYFFEITGSSEIAPHLLKECYKRAMKRARFLKSIIEKHVPSEDREFYDNEAAIEWEAMQEENVE